MSQFIKNAICKLGMGLIRKILNKIWKLYNSFITFVP